mmetsp:Transcript_2618/g.5857  ORF Transcript_2618/g.5857 Transcript_2618/m.5857 type:complete len:211 (+) Transcript_2618:329-961(+)
MHRESVLLVAGGGAPLRVGRRDLLRHPRLTDQIVPQELPEDGGILALHVILVVLQDQLGLPVPLRALPDERRDAIGQFILAESIQDFDDALGIDVGGHGSIETVRGQFVLVEVLGTRHRFGNGHEEIVRLGVQVVECLEVDGAVGTGPARSGRMIGFQGEGGEVRSEIGIAVVVVASASSAEMSVGRRKGGVGRCGGGIGGGGGFLGFVE